MKWSALFIMSFVFYSFVSVAQKDISEDSLIEISGRINCFDPLNGGLTAVSVYNISQHWGTVSDASGKYSIKMAKNDTIVFFTTEHKDYHYYLKKGDPFIDHEIDVYMETDAVWLEAVNIIGLSSLDEFKRDVLELEVTEDHVSLYLPTINKYAKQVADADEAPVLVGPLTYLQKKISAQFNRKKNMQKAVRK